MAKSQNSFIKQQKAKAKKEKRANKLERKHDKKNHAPNSDIHDMSKLEYPEDFKEKREE